MPAPAPGPVVPQDGRPGTGAGLKPVPVLNGIVTDRYTGADRAMRLERGSRIALVLTVVSASRAFAVAEARPYLQPRCRSTVMPRYRVVMSENGPKPRASKSPLKVLGDIADASWDIFVMPGEYANSRYDRPMEPLDASEITASTRNTNTSFSWGGSSNEQEALRLATGIKAAERLAPPSVSRPRGLWFEVEGRDAAMLSRDWTRLWAVVVVVTVLANGWSGLRDLQRRDQTEGSGGSVGRDALLRAQRLRGGALAQEALCRARLHGCGSAITLALPSVHAARRQKRQPSMTEPDETPTAEERPGDATTGALSGESSEGDLGERLNALLDRSVFDPDSRGRDEPRLLAFFRAKFDEDPEFATTLFVGFYFAVLLCAAQQGVRIFKHCYFLPDKLCPWDVGPSVDELLNF